MIIHGAEVGTVCTTHDFGRGCLVEVVEFALEEYRSFCAPYVARTEHPKRQAPIPEGQTNALQHHGCMFWTSMLRHSQLCKHCFKVQVCSLLWATGIGTSCSGNPFLECILVMHRRDTETHKHHSIAPLGGLQYYSWPVQVALQINSRTKAHKVRRWSAKEHIIGGFSIFLRTRLDQSELPG